MNQIDKIMYNYEGAKILNAEIRKHIKTVFPTFAYNRVFTEKRKGGKLRSHFLGTHNLQEEVVKFVNSIGLIGVKAELTNYKCYGRIPMNDVVIKISI